MFRSSPNKVISHGCYRADSVACSPNTHEPNGLFFDHCSQIDITVGSRCGVYSIVVSFYVVEVHLLVDRLYQLSQSPESVFPNLSVHHSRLLALHYLDSQCSCQSAIVALTKRSGTGVEQKEFTDYGVWTML